MYPSTARRRLTMSEEQTVGVRVASSALLAETAAMKKQAASLRTSGRRRT